MKLYVTETSPYCRLVRAFVDTADPIETGPHGGLKSRPVDVGRVYLLPHYFASSERMEIAPDGERVLHLSTHPEDDWLDHTEPSCAGGIAYLRNRDGTSRRILSNAFESIDSVTLLNDDTFFFVPCTSALPFGLYRWSPAEGSVQVDGGVGVRVGPVARDRRRVAYRALGSDPLGTRVYVAPY